MKAIELIETGNYFPYRRKAYKPTFFAKYPNGDYFQSSGNNKQIFYMTKKGLMDNLTIHAKNLWSSFKNSVEDIHSEEEMIEYFIDTMEILSF